MEALIENIGSVTISFSSVVDGMEALNERYGSVTRSSSSIDDGKEPLKVIYSSVTNYVFLRRRRQGGVAEGGLHEGQCSAQEAAPSWC